MIKVRLWLWLLALALSLLTMALLARPAAALPPRPSPELDGAPAGGSIELHVWSAGTVDWSTVQTGVEWQDGNGGWHAVDGWRGRLDELYTDGGRKTWWVGQEYLGAGPFRWVIYQDGEMRAASEGFTMPASQGHLVRIVVQMDE